MVPIISYNILRGIIFGTKVQSIKQYDSYKNTKIDTLRPVTILIMAFIQK